MVRIYVRIPRNRWAPIGEIDLDGYLAVYGGRRGGPVFIEEDVLSAIKKTTRLTRQIRAYEEKHLHSLMLANLNEFWGWGRKDVRRHVKHLRALRQQWEKTSPYRLLAKRKTRLPSG